MLPRAPGFTQSNQQYRHLSFHPLSPISIEALVSGLNFGPSILHTPPNPAPTQSTPPLISKPPYNVNVKPTYTLMSSRISWHLTPFSTHSPFTLQTAGIPNHVVWATSSGYTKPRLCQEHSIYQTTCPHSTNHLQHHSTKGHYDTLYGLITLPFK